MQLSLKCKVDSTIRISNTIEICENLKKYVFIPNGKGFLDSIEISMSISSSESPFTKIEKGDEQVAAKITVNYDKETRGKLIYEFQKLESRLAFATAFSGGCLRRIYWDQPVVNLVPENEKEKERVQVTDIQYQKTPPAAPVFLDPTNLRGTVSTLDKYETLIIPQSFFREGVNELNSFRYINAFYNFYYVIEGSYYSEGKTKDKRICEQFKNHPEVRKIVEMAIEIISGKPEQLGKIQKLLKDENLLFGIDGIIELLVKFRGYLHHYFSPSSKPKPSPFNQEGFEDIALLAMLIASFSISAGILALNTGKHFDE